ncbi:IS66 family insertion sequence element accessory protein TnpB [Bacillus chungangensis]|uniref:Spore coat protein n=1 Tax=Bacillus chungangensis TaxID=587633 RepID=A0ABT9WRP6_9BACI|nr:IS66 family insertion sequence element accessory protein TnpB [Bacillus chungangensis]MDQ0175961.1 hypothetical protein [Bacillus chungangensis]
MKQDYTSVKNIYIICGKTDMRKGIDRLATLIQDSFELDPYSDSINSHEPTKSRAVKKNESIVEAETERSVYAANSTLNRTFIWLQNREIQILPDGQGSLLEDNQSFDDSEHTEEQSQQTVPYTVIRKVHKKKRNDSLRDGVEAEKIHHHPDNTICDCCQYQLIEIGGTVVREEANCR